MLESIAFIPDGNRRYALARKMSLAEAYSVGFDKGRDVLEWCFEKPGVREVTIWSLSTENLRRSPREISLFLDLLRHKLEDVIDDEKVHEGEIKFKVIGRLGLLPKGVREVSRRLEEATAGYSKKRVNLCIGYGGRAELVDAITKLVSHGSSVDEDAITKALYVENSPDLIVRTGGTKRLSGFMPWQSAYSELYFSETLWPEFQRTDLQDALDDFDSRQRRFGL